MGKISKRVLGAVKGKVGDVAFRDWRQMPVVATYAAENKSSSEEQRKQRSLLSQVSKELKTFLCPLRLGMKFAGAVGTTEWAEGIKTNWDVLVSNGEFVPSNFRDIQLSKGGLKVPSLSSASYIDGTLTITWNYSTVNPCGKNNPADRVVVVIGLVDADGVFDGQAYSTTFAREAGSGAIEMPSSMGTDPSKWAIYAFAFNDSPEVADASPTEYILGE